MKKEERGIIAAVSPEGVIGVGGKIPWRHPGDMKRFKRLTLGTTIIMGRKTWESMDSKPLPGRRNVVITSRRLAGTECFPDIPSALATCTGTVWFVGGSRIYEEAMEHADIIDVTYVPDQVDASGAVYFPAIDKSLWKAGPLLSHEDEPGLKRRVYRRKAR